jgi:hypothetical protein
LIFNRPDLVRQTFPWIKAQQPKQLFIGADGPREGNENDLVKCAECRDWVLDQINCRQKQGFKKFIFEDNYPRNKGDCFSLKKAFMGEAYELSKKTGVRRIWSLPKELFSKKLSFDEMESEIKTYYEFPPVFKSEMTRQLG